jgi:hypothetical protein
MAIGSAPEIGTEFTTLDGFDWVQWYASVGPDLMGGYGKILFPSETRIREIDDEWNHLLQ